MAVGSETLATEPVGECSGRRCASVVLAVDLDSGCVFWSGCQLVMIHGDREQHDPGEITGASFEEPFSPGLCNTNELYMMSLWTCGKGGQRSDPIVGRTFCLLDGDGGRFMTVVHAQYALEFGMGHELFGHTNLHRTMGQFGWIGPHDQRGLSNVGLIPAVQLVAGNVAHECNHIGWRFPYRRAPFHAAAGLFFYRHCVRL